jgi:glycosyltransferase involved in cell wall biosynthesis
VQVGLKAGIPALLFKFLYHIDYLLFERWTGFLPEARPNFNDLSFIKKWWWHRIIRHSVKLLTVSAYFGRMIQQYHYKKNMAVIPNAVNSYFAHKRDTKTGNEFQFIHVSNMDYQKNFEDVLIAVSVLVKNNNSFQLVVYGPVHAHITEQVKRMQLTEFICFKGEVSHTEIAKAMQASHALVFYSRFETFGNVVIEANACGIPVIVSDHPVFREIVEEGVSGLIVPGEKPALLAASMQWMMNNPQHFDGEKISAATHAKFSPVHISNLFDHEFRTAFRGH